MYNFYFDYFKSKTMYTYHKFENKFLIMINNSLSFIVYTENYNNLLERLYNVN